MTMTDKKLLRLLASRIEANPDIVPQVLEASSKGMKAWEAKVKRHLDGQADIAISAALGLPKRIKRLSLKNRAHRSLARLVVVGWGLKLRQPSSEEERTLCDFLEDADVAFPEDAASHYQVIQAR